MSQYKDVAMGDTVFFWFAVNDLDGNAANGTDPLYTVRLAGGPSGASPVAGPTTPTLLTHVNYTDGLYEIAILTSAPTYQAGSEYAVFCTATISSTNPAGFVGSFVVHSAGNDLYTLVSDIEAKTANLPASPAAVGSEMEVGDKTGFSLSASGLLAIWHTLLADITTALTIGKKLKDLAVDDDGRVDVGLIEGEAPITEDDITARILADPNTPLSNDADGVVRSNLYKILGTALTETSGYIAAAFKKFFNVATPTGTANSLPDAVPGTSSGLALKSNVDAMGGIVAGPGDRSCTITLRTTGAVAIGGASLWLNTVNVRSGSIITPATTAQSTGQVTLNLSDGTYYVFVSKIGYEFAAATITVDSTHTTFTLSIGTAVSAAAAGAFDDSFLSRMITSIRRYIDEPSISAKYTDAVLIAEVEKAYPVLLSEINRNKLEDIVVARHQIAVTTAAATYILPPYIESVIAVYEEDASYGFKVFYDGLGVYNEVGRGIWIEGNELRIGPNVLTEALTLTVEYVPSGTARLHNGTCTLDAAGLVATFGSTTNAGSLDTHPHAYEGCILRILSAGTNNYIQERTIRSYDHTTRAATLSAALSPIPATDIAYEICPPIFRGLDDAIASYTAMILVSVESNTKRAVFLRDLHAQRMRNLRLNAYYSNLFRAGRVRNDDVSNSRRFKRRL